MTPDVLAWISAFSLPAVLIAWGEGRMRTGRLIQKLDDTAEKLSTLSVEFREHTRAEASMQVTVAGRLSRIEGRVNGKP